MALADDLTTEVKRIFRDSWSERDGHVVPDAEDVNLQNDSINFKRATVLYADLSGSTTMVQSKKWQFSAEIYRTYLYCAAKLIRDMDGSITAYDGDRVMGIFIGGNQSTNAVKCALKINYAVQKIITPALDAQYPNSGFVLKQVVGVDTSPVHVARTGVRGDNDLVWVGRAANYAAKLTELNEGPPSWITKAVFDVISEEAKFGGSNKELMWKHWKWTEVDGSDIYSSTWWWAI
jgi:class 3 adenylate cyclase